MQPERIEKLRDDCASVVVSHEWELMSKRHMCMSARMIAVALTTSVIALNP